LIIQLIQYKQLWGGSKIPLFFIGGDKMIERKLDYVIRQNNAILDMLESLTKAYAKVNNLALEHVEEECEYIESFGINK
jgi:hypothetical protein